MKDECEIRVMLANLEAEKKNLQRQCSDLSIQTIESEFVFMMYDVKIKLLKEILETEDNDCY